ncbi:hypothetical protein QTJ16_001065 [Diplocarpon rosae]|uniref:Alkyl hydroperoxide reductase subunit C/ Thiol specific antioxidant domain-containing protein n=1 Tax=Diplocarpon rosae TaxID=946125 RepID=A0AAD9T837_9HELO|nr:hypothetical protein QTJ16_001065 [Diplocarpon rosae]
MTFQQEFTSWFPPKALATSSVPEPGNLAPSTQKLPFPPSDGKPALVTFLRHCGCPFAEKTFLSLRDHASKHPITTHIAVSHSSPAATETWLASVGGPGSVQVLVDDAREIYAQWGLGVSSTWHVLNPWSLWEVYALGKREGIWNRPTESGSRWQTAGSFAVDGEGVVRWARVMGKADEVPDFEEGDRVLGERLERGGLG